MCLNCGVKGTWSEDTEKCISSWNRRAYETLAPKSKLVVLVPRMSELLRHYCEVIEEYVSIYDNFPEDLQEVATQANELLEQLEEEEEEDE